MLYLFTKTNIKNILIYINKILIDLNNVCYNLYRCGGSIMAVDYSNLWKLLIDKRMNKSQLRKAAQISTNAIAKLGRNETVSLDTLEKICDALSCSIEDIMSFTANSSKGEKEND